MTQPMIWGDWPQLSDISGPTTYPDPEAENVNPTIVAEHGEDQKRRAACDECRKRKLKCSGEATGCSRCVKQNIICHYSEQKQMGRPRKKQKTSDSEEASTKAASDIHSQPLPQPSAEEGPSQAIHGKDRYAAPCPMVWAQHVKAKSLNLSGGIGGSPETGSSSGPGIDSESTPPEHSPPTPSYLSYPTSMAAWPDYSTMSQLPQPVLDKSQATSESSEPSFGSLDSLPQVPACPCLPNLYLTLSTLSTVNSFPVSQHTLESLITASRTAHSVLYCAICPTKFQSGMQNMMLLGTLLNVLADSWNRVRLAPAKEMQQGFGSARACECNPDTPLTLAQDLSWRLFAYCLLRAHVFGDRTSPTSWTLPDGSKSDSSCPFTCPKGVPITLSWLASALERRQQFYHGEIVDTGEFPPSTRDHGIQLSLNEMMCAKRQRGLNDEKNYLCLNIVRGVRTVLSTLDRSPPTCADLNLDDHVHLDDQECDIYQDLSERQRELLAGNIFTTHSIDDVPWLTGWAHKDIIRTKAGTPVRFLFRETGEELEVKRYPIHNKQVVVARIPRLRDLVIIKAHSEHGHHDYWYIWHGVFGWEARPSVMRQLLHAEFAKSVGPIGMEELRGYHDPRRLLSSSYSSPERHDDHRISKRQRTTSPEHEGSMNVMGSASRRIELRHGEPRKYRDSVDEVHDHFASNRRTEDRQQAPGHNDTSITSNTVSRENPPPPEIPPSRVSPMVLSTKVLNNTTMTFIDCRNGNERSKFLHQCDTSSKLFIQALAGHVFPKPNGLCVLELQLSRQREHRLVILQDDEDDFEKFVKAVQDHPCWDRDGVDKLFIEIRALGGWD